MTRETYIKVARAVNKQLRKAGNSNLTIARITIAANTFAMLAKDDNHRFNDRKFFEACGIVSDPRNLKV